MGKISFDIEKIRAVKYQAIADARRQAAEKSRRVLADSDRLYSRSHWVHAAKGMARHILAGEDTHTTISWDWKGRPYFEDLRDALEPLGIRVYADRLHAGTDQFGFIFASRDLSAEELQAIGGRGDVLPVR